MGYRHYFYLVEKEEVEKVRRMNYDELFDYAKNKKCAAEDEDGKWIDFIDKNFMNKKEIFEFGKLYYDNTAERIYSTGIPLFENKETQDEFSDYVPYIVGKSGLEMAIQIYKEKILKYFKSLVTKECASRGIVEFTVKPEDLKVAEVCQEIEGKISRWSNFFGCCPINMNESSESITNSWLFEYNIFELVRLYKSIDWDKYDILFYGW